MKVLLLVLVLAFIPSASSFAITDADELQSVIVKASTDDLLLLREMVDAELNRRYEAIKSIKETEIAYTLNANSWKFHIPSCDSVTKMKEKNKKEYKGDRQELIDMGYEPCSVCHP
jgi:hypothetical protein